MHVYVIFAHPSKRSFSRSVLDAFARGLKEAGHSYEIAALYEMGFQSEMDEAQYFRSMSRRALGSMVVLLVATSTRSACVVASANQLQDERALVAGVVRDYFEGWYTGDADRIGRALRPDMVKLYVEALSSGRQVVQSATRDLMIEMTRAGGGSKTPPERRNIVVDVLDVTGDIAIARASSFQYLEYLSLARCNGQWTIINILWRFQTPPSAPR